MLRNEYDRRSPKLRLVVLGYLAGPDKAPSIDDLNSTLDWLVEDQEGFLAAIEASLPEDDPTDESEITNLDVKKIPSDAYGSGSYL